MLSTDAWRKGDFEPKKSQSKQTYKQYIADKKRFEALKRSESSNI